MLRRLACRRTSRRLCRRCSRDGTLGLEARGARVRRIRRRRWEDLVQHATELWLTILRSKTSIDLCSSSCSRLLDWNRLGGLAPRTEPPTPTKTSHVSCFCRKTGSCRQLAEACGRLHFCLERDQLVRWARVWVSAVGVPFPGETGVARCGLRTCRQLRPGLAPKIHSNGAGVFGVAWSSPQPVSRGVAPLPPPNTVHCHRLCRLSKLSLLRRSNQQNQRTEHRFIWTQKWGHAQMKSMITCSKWC